MAQGPAQEPKVSLAALGRIIRDMYEGPIREGAGPLTGHLLGLSEEDRARLNEWCDTAPLEDVIEMLPDPDGMS